MCSAAFFHKIVACEVNTRLAWQKHVQPENQGAMAFSKK
jgi:hypothetical protein